MKWRSSLRTPRDSASPPSRSTDTPPVTLGSGVVMGELLFVETFDLIQRSGTWTEVAESNQPGRGGGNGQSKCLASQVATLVGLSLADTQEAQSDEGLCPVSDEGGVPSRERQGERGLRLGDTPGARVAIPLPPVRNAIGREPVEPRGILAPVTPVECVVEAIQRPQAGVRVPQASLRLRLAEGEVGGGPRRGPSRGERAGRLEEGKGLGSVARIRQSLAPDGKVISPEERIARLVGELDREPLVGLGGLKLTLVAIDEGGFPRRLAGDRGQAGTQCRRGGSAQEVGGQSYLLGDRSPH